MEELKEWFELMDEDKQKDYKRIIDSIVWVIMYVRRLELSQGVWINEITRKPFLRQIFKEGFSKRKKFKLHEFKTL